jgi:hypothetical protein
LDLSAEKSRLANEAGVKIAISANVHSTREFGTVRYGIDPARRAARTGFYSECLPWVLSSRCFGADKK